MGSPPREFTVRMEFSMSTRHFLPAVAVAFLLFCLPAAAGEKKPILFVYTWSDYFAPDVLDRFEAEFDCRVAIDYFD